MKPQKRKNKFVFRGAIVTLAVAVLFSFGFPRSANAALWPTIDPMIQSGLNQIMSMIQGMIMGAAKKAAINALTKQVDKMISGGSSGNAAFITNWQDYLIAQPENAAKTYINDYLSQMTGGRNTLSGYQSEGFSGTGNYKAQMAQAAQNNIAQTSSDYVAKPTYEGDPTQMFAGSSFKNMELYLSGVNNPWAFSANVETKYQQNLEGNKMEAATQGEAYGGYRGTVDKATGTVTTPGSTIKDLVASVQSMPLNSLSNANSISEVITSVVSQLITKSIQQGFDGIQRKVQKSASELTSQESATSSAIQTGGPGARFGN